MLRAIVAAPAVARLEALREVRAAAEAAERADISARASYNAKVTLDWLRKHQATCSRALYRSFDELRKLRRDFGDDPAMAEAAAGPPAPDPCGATHAPVTPTAGPRESAGGPEAGAARETDESLSQGGGHGQVEALPEPLSPGRAPHKCVAVAGDPSPPSPRA